jgi:hypothetical protein
MSWGSTQSSGEPTLSIFTIWDILTLVITSFALILHITISLVRAAGTVARAVAVSTIVVSVSAIVVPVAPLVITVMSVVIALIPIVSTRRIVPTTTAGRRGATTAGRSTVTAAVAT